MTSTNQTNSALKRYFYSGIGFVAHSGDIMQKSVDEIVKRGKLSESEGKQIMDNAIQRLESGYNEAIHKLGAFSTREISKLQTRVMNIEKQLAIKRAGSMVSSGSRSGKTTRTTTRAKKVSAKKGIK